MLDLEKMRDMAKSLQQMQQQMEKIGKDLAEQLDKMLAEVSKAVDPAGNYGKVAEFLKDAAKSMKAGEKPGAATALANASKELDKLMQQMGDAQAMMSELDA